MTASLYLGAPQDTLKMLRETLCVAQTAIGVQFDESTRAPGHIDRLGRIIEEIDRQRPLGPDGKHGDRHTATCGCEPANHHQSKDEAIGTWPAVVDAGDR